VPLQLVPDIHRATHRIGLHLEAASPPLGLTQGEAHLLAHLLEAGTSPLAALHAAFAHKRSTLTSYLDRLEARGLVTRTQRKEDRRAFVVTLTREGRALAARVHRRLAQLEEAALAALPARDVQGFRAVLGALLAAAEPAPRSKAARR
jgi:DNA-binding MarR family transcriptional regulator